MKKNNIIATLIITVSIVTVAILGIPRLFALLLQRPVEPITNMRLILQMLTGLILGIAMIKNIIPFNKLTIKKGLELAVKIFSLFVLAVILFTTKEWDKFSIIAGVITWLLFTTGSSFVCLFTYKILNQKG